MVLPHQEYKFSRDSLHLQHGSLQVVSFAGLKVLKHDAFEQVQTYSYSTQLGDHRQADFDPASFLQRFQDAAMGSLFDELEGSFSEMEANMRKLFRPAGMHICGLQFCIACRLTMSFGQERDIMQLGVSCAFLCSLLVCMLTLYDGRHKHSVPKRQSNFLSPLHSTCQ